MDQFIHWWQHLPSQMSPTLFQIGGFAVRYYGLMYLLAFLTAYLLIRYRMKKEPSQFRISVEILQSLVSVSILGLIIGARLGYIIFYNLQYYLQHPLQMILPFDIANGWRFIGISGMSFHGGLIGVLLAAFLFLRKHEISYFQAANLVVPCCPLGYTFGRFGNFINGELWGRETDWAIGMYFPDAPGNELRHPSQLYEAFFEGLVLFGILWMFRRG